MREHGQAVTYRFGIEGGSDSTNGCRCDECREAVREYERQRRQRTEPAYVTAATARRHVTELSEAGVGLKQIVKVSGISQGAIWKLMYGKNGKPSKRIRRETQDKILAVTPADAADGARVAAERTLDNIETLLERGWTKTAIARELGQKGPGLQLGTEQVTAGHARAVAALLDQPVPPRHTRWGPVEIEWEPPEDDLAQGGDDIDRLYLSFAAALEARQEPWRRRAACRFDATPTAMFFPGRGDQQGAQAARDVCATCPVSAECAADAANERHGIWAGKSEHERRQDRRAS